MPRLCCMEVEIMAPQDRDLLMEKITMQRL